jgi:uncharacterized membrane protein
MGSTETRSLVKGIVWEGFSFIITTLAVWVLFGDFSMSVKFSLLLTCIKVVFFFFHERLWKHIRWGKIKG